MKSQYYYINAGVIFGCKEITDDLNHENGYICYQSADFSTGCPRMFYTVFQKNIKNIKSTVSLIIILVIQCLICALPTVKISFTYLYPLRCDMVSLKIDE